MGKVERSVAAVKKKCSDYPLTLLWIASMLTLLVLIQFADLILDW